MPGEKRGEERGGYLDKSMSVSMLMVIILVRLWPLLLFGPVLLLLVWWWVVLVQGISSSTKSSEGEQSGNELLN